MKTSDSIKEIASAMNKAQAEMTGAKKSADNPFFKSKYSDLSMVMEAINKPFSNNGLSFIQAAEFQEGMIAVTTRIMHTSGEWLESTTCLPPVKNDAQGYGSAISYGKRYSLQAMAGVPSVDDDGQEAVKQNAPPKKMSLAQAKRILGETADTVFTHYQNKDAHGIHEVMSELEPNERIALQRIYTHQDNNIFDDILALYSSVENAA